MEREEGIWGGKEQAWVLKYSPRRMRYRTWFYAAFVCAYACCLSSGMSPRGPGRVPGESRSWARRRESSSCSASGDPCFDPCPVPCCGPSAGSSRRSVCRMACGLKNGCRSSWIWHSRCPVCVLSLSSHVHCWKNRLESGDVEVFFLDLCLCPALYIDLGSCCGWPSPRTDTAWSVASFVQPALSVYPKENPC